MNARAHAPARIALSSGGPRPPPNRTESVSRRSSAALGGGEPAISHWHGRTRRTWGREFLGAEDITSRPAPVGNRGRAAPTLVEAGAGRRCRGGS